MGACRALTAGVAVVAVLSSCGGDDDASSTTGTSTSSSTTAASAPATFRTRLLRSNELAGFHVADVSVHTTPNSWVSAEQIPADQAAAEKAMLKRDGFSAGVHEDLMSGGTGGASIVEQFRSPQTAADALDFYRMQSKAFGPYARFKVTGVPDAVGFSLGGVNGGGINIMFSDGAYYYLVGREAGSRAAVKTLNTAARQLYLRVHG